MIVAGLDLSLRGTGICILGKGLLKTFNVGVTIDTKNKALDTDREKIERLITISSEVLKRLREYSVREVGIENYAFSQMSRGASSSGTALGELSGVIKKDLWVLYSILPKMYAPTTARKAVFGPGKGRMKKADVQAKLVELGLEFPTHDEGDAFVIAATRWMELYDCEIPYTFEDFWKERPWRA